MADYEILELLLGYGLTRKDTKPLAKELIQRFGNIRGALDARPEELLEIPGFGPGLVALWRVLGETRARYAAAEVRQRSFNWLGGRGPHGSGAVRHKPA